MASPSARSQRVRNEERRPQLLASSPANSRFHPGFGLLYPPHVTRPAAPPPTPPSPRPLALPGDEPALPATGCPPSVLPCSSPPSRPRRLFPLPPQAAVPSRRSPPPVAVPPPGLPSPQSELTVSKMAAVSVWGISAVRPGPPGSRLSSPQVRGRGAVPGHAQLPSPRLGRPGVCFGASRGRRAAAGPAAACAASRCSAPGLGLGAAAAPSRPTPRPGPCRPPGSRPQPAAALAPPAAHSRSWGSRALSSQAAEPGAAVRARPLSLGGAPAVRPPLPAPGAHSGLCGVRGDPSGVERCGVTAW